jgi:hypothetical protein
MNNIKSISLLIILLTYNLSVSITNNYSLTNFNISNNLTFDNFKPITFISERNYFHEILVIPDNYKDTNRVVSIPDNLMILIPMTSLVFIPIIYPTHYFETYINGENVIVQLWKGYYPGILGFPDGIGAEVGLYYPVPWSNNLWLPDFKHPRDISFRLILKSTNEVILNASDKTWWLNKWKQDYSNFPIKGEDYILEFSIDGIESSW